MAVKRRYWHSSPGMRPPGTRTREANWSSRRDDVRGPKLHGALDRVRTDASTQDKIRSSAPRLVYSLTVRRRTREKIANFANFFSRERPARTSQQERYDSLHCDHQGVLRMPRESSRNQGNAKLSTSFTAYPVAFACELHYRPHNKCFHRRRGRRAGFQGNDQKSRRT